MRGSLRVMNTPSFEDGPGGKGEAVGVGVGAGVNVAVGNAGVAVGRAVEVTAGDGVTVAAGVAADVAAGVSVASARGVRVGVGVGAGVRGRQAATRVERPAALSPSRKARRLRRADSGREGRVRGSLGSFNMI